MSYGKLNPVRGWVLVKLIFLCFVASYFATAHIVQGGLPGSDMLALLLLVAIPATVPTTTIAKMDERRSDFIGEVS